MRSVTQRSYLAEDAAQVLAAGDEARLVKVLHDLVEPDGHLLVLGRVAASKLGVLLAEGQRLLRLERRLVVQTLRVAAPPPGLEEQQQRGPEGPVPVGEGRRGHGAEDAVLRSLLARCTIQRERVREKEAKYYMSNGAESTFRNHFVACPCLVFLRLHLSL